MDANEHKPGISLVPLALTWLVLTGLTVVSPHIGDSLGAQPLAQLIVAAIIWVKSALVARHFIEAERVHPFIRNVLRLFISFAPVAIALMAFFSTELARWTTL